MINQQLEREPECGLIFNIFQKQQNQFQTDKENKLTSKMGENPVTAK